jgi:purine-cytosine permease-like protein
MFHNTFLYNIVSVILEYILMTIVITCIEYLVEQHDKKKTNIKDTFIIFIPK